jgi:hypothetical protein
MKIKINLKKNYRQTAHQAVAASSQTLTWALVLLAMSIALGSIPFVLASVPKHQDISNDTAILQKLHEIKVKKAKPVDITSDIQVLSAQEKAYRTPLHYSEERISSPSKRIQNNGFKKIR